MAEGNGNESISLDTVEKAPNSSKEVAILETPSESLEAKSDEASKVKVEVGSSSEKSVASKFLRRDHKYSHNVSSFSQPEEEFDFGNLVDFVIVDEVDAENDDLDDISHTSETNLDTKVVDKVQSSMDCSSKQQNYELMNEDSVADVRNYSVIFSMKESSDEFHGNNGHAKGSHSDENILDNLDLDDEGDEFYMEVKNLSEATKDLTAAKKLISNKDCKVEKELGRKRDSAAKIKISVEDSMPLKKKKSSPLKKKEYSQLKKKESSQLKKKESSPLKKKESLSGHVCRIPGLSFIIGIKPDEPSNVKKNRYDCVLCNNKKENLEVLFSGSEMKSHAQSRRHVLNVMHIWNHEFYQNYLRNNSTSWITTSKLLDELLKYEATQENQKIVVASRNTYAKQRESVNLKIKNLLDVNDASYKKKASVSSDDSAKQNIANRSNIIASPVSSDDSAKEIIEHQKHIVAAPVSSDNSETGSIAKQSMLIASPVSSDESANESNINQITSIASTVSSDGSLKESTANLDKVAASPVSLDDSFKESTPSQDKVAASPVSSEDFAKGSIANQNKIAAAPVSSDDSAKVSISNHDDIAASPVSSDDSAKGSIANQINITASPVSSDDSAKENTAIQDNVATLPVFSGDSEKESLITYNKIIASPALSHEPASPIDNPSSTYVPSSPIRVSASPISLPCIKEALSTRKIKITSKHVIGNKEASKKNKKEEEKKRILTENEVGYDQTTSESNRPMRTFFERVIIVADCHYFPFLKKISSNNVKVIFTDSTLQIDNLQKEFRKECSNKLSKNTLYLFVLGLHFITKTEPWSVCEGLYKCRMPLDISIIKSKDSVHLIKSMAKISMKVLSDIDCIKRSLPSGSNIAILPPFPVSIFPVEKMHETAHDLLLSYPETIFAASNEDKLFHDCYPIFMEKFSSLSFTSLKSCCARLHDFMSLIKPKKTYSLKIRAKPSSCEETDSGAWLKVAIKIAEIVRKEGKLVTSIVPATQDIHEVLITNVPVNVSAESIKSCFQSFGNLVGIHMKNLQGNTKSALLIFEKSSMIEDTFINKRHRIDETGLQIHRSEWPRDQTRAKAAVIFKNETQIINKKKVATSTVPSVVGKSSIQKQVSKKEVDTSTIPCVVGKSSIQKKNSTSTCDELILKKLCGNKIVYSVEKISLDLIDDKLRKNGIKEVHSYIDKLEGVYKGRKKSHIVIVTDERENLDAHLNEFDKSVEILKIPGLQYESSLDVVKMHPCFGKGTIFIFSCGTNDLLQKFAVKECCEFQCSCLTTYLALKDIKYEQHYLISRALKLNMSILSCTENDIALFCGLLPVRLKQYNRYILNKRVCHSRHPVSDIPHTDHIKYNKYQSAIASFNKFTKWHAKKLGFEPWQLEAPFSDTTKQLTLANGFNVSPSDDIERINKAKTLCCVLVLSFFESCQSNCELSSKTTTDKITERKIEEKSEKSLENSTVSKANQNCDKYPVSHLQSQLFSHHQQIISNIINLQKDRMPTNIVIVTDERDNFDLYFANYDARVGIMKIPGLKLEEAFVSVREHPQFGKGTLFIFSAGTHDLHTQVPLSDCMNFGCPTPQFILINSFPLYYDTQNLVSKALEVHMAILSSTTDDIALFCGLLPIIQHRYNIHIVHHRPCLSFHPAMYPPDCVIQNYNEILSYFNVFSKYHAQVLGYTPWDLDAPYFVKPIQEILLPNCYNFHPDEEANRSNHAKYLCNNLMTTLSSSIKIDDTISTQNDLGITHLTQGDSFYPVIGSERNQKDGMQNKFPIAISSSDEKEIITVPKELIFHEVFFIGRRESVSMLSGCNVKSTLIYYNFNSDMDLDVKRVLNKIGKIPEKSICCLVFDLAVITKTVKSTQCHKYSCEESLLVNALQHSVDNLKEISKELQSIEKFANKLSIHIPVLILPLAPMRIFCDDNDYQMHRIGHTINTMGFSVVDGSRSLWQSALQYITNSWISLVKEVNKKYDMNNYISNFAENNREVFSILDYVSDFLADWKEQLHWKSFLYSSLSCIVKSTPNYVESIDQRLPNNCNKRNSRSASLVRLRSRSNSQYRQSHSKIWLEDERTRSPSPNSNGRVKKDSFTYYNRRISPDADQYELRFRSEQKFRTLNSRSRSRSSSCRRSQAFISGSLNYRSQLSLRRSWSLSGRRSRSLSRRRSRSLSRRRSRSLSRRRSRSLSRIRSRPLSHRRSRSLSHRRSSSISHKRSRSLSRRRSRPLGHNRSRSLSHKRSRSLSRRRSKSLSRRRSRSLSRRRSRSLSHRRSRSVSRRRTRLSSSRLSESNNHNIVSNPIIHKMIQKSTSDTRKSHSTNLNRVLTSIPCNKTLRSTSHNRMQNPPIHDRISRSSSQSRMTTSHNRELRIKNQQRSRSKSYTRRPSSKLHSKNSPKSGSKRDGNRSRSISPPSKKSKGVSVKYLRRSELDSHTSRTRSRSKFQGLSGSLKPHTMPNVHSDCKSLPRIEVAAKPCNSATRKRPHSKSISPFTKRPKTAQQPTSSLQPESTQTSLSYTDDELRHKFGTELFEVYASELKEMQFKFDEEFEAFRTAPEFHPNFELYYERFVDKYSTQYRNKDEQYKDTLWRVFWKSNFDMFKKEEFLIRQQKLIEDFETTEALLLNNRKTSPKKKSNRDTPFSFEAALSLIEKLSEDILYLGPSMKSIINKSRSLGTTTKEAYIAFTNSDNLEVLDFIFNKFKSLSMSSEDELRFMYDKAVEWIPKVIEEAKKGSCQQLELRTDDIPIDLNAIAKISRGKSTEFTIELIQTALAYEGIGEPSTQLINELFMKVCALHFKLKNG